MARTLPVTLLVGHEVDELLDGADQRGLEVAVGRHPAEQLLQKAPGGSADAEARRARPPSTAAAGHVGPGRRCPRPPGAPPPRRRRRGGRSRARAGWRTSSASPRLLGAVHQVVEQHAQAPARAGVEAADHVGEVVHAVEPLDHHALPRGGRRPRPSRPARRRGSPSTRMRLRPGHPGRAGRRGHRARRGAGGGRGAVGRSARPGCTAALDEEAARQRSHGLCRAVAIAEHDPRRGERLDRPDDARGAVLDHQPRRAARPRVGGVDEPPSRSMRAGEDAVGASPVGRYRHPGPPRGPAVVVELVRLASRVAAAPPQTASARTSVRPASLWRSRAGSGLCAGSRESSRGASAVADTCRQERSTCRLGVVATS